MWHSYKEAGRPFPALSDDPYIDYLIIEALTLKGYKEKEEAEKKAKTQAEIDEFKSDQSFKEFEERLNSGT